MLFTLVASRTFCLFLAVEVLRLSTKKFKIVCPKFIRIPARYNLVSQAGNEIPIRLHLLPRKLTTYYGY